jgi:hypothetical protein
MARARKRVSDTPEVGKSVKKTRRESSSGRWVIISPEAMNRFKKATSTKQASIDYLVEAGLITRDGKLHKNFRVC